MQAFYSPNSTAVPFRLLFAVPLFLMFAVCGRTPPAAPPTAPVVQSKPLEPGDANRSLIYAGIERKYVLHLPVGCDAARAAPLVLAFHGIGLNAEEMIRITNLNQQSDQSGFVVVYPNGTGESKSWNGGHCCGEPAKNKWMMLDSCARLSTN